MISALDCALLSEDVYNRDNNNLAARAGWRRLDARNWGHGFAAGAYVRGNERVVAFRGTDTDDPHDILADAQMVPDAPPDRVAQVIPSLLRHYGLSDSTELRVGGALLGGILNSGRARRFIRAAGNQIPARQSRQASEYITSQSPAPAVVTGHSLGGALAQYISVSMALPGVAFNSPFMGDLRGMPPVCGNLVKINTRGDPLSLATEAAGNLAHGEVVLVDIPRHAGSPPPPPRMEAYHRPNVCPRASTAGNIVENYLSGQIASTCEALVDVWEPVGRAATAPQRGLNFIFSTYPDYVSSLLGYLGSLCGHYHSMENLRRQMERDRRFQQALPTV